MTSSGGSSSDTPDGRISVLLAARDVERFLPKTLRSLHAQTQARFELVAVDDGSVDGTGAILAAHARAASPDRPVRLIRTEGIGLAAARNLAMEASGGALLVTLDGDDILASDLLERTRDILLGRSDLDLVFPICDHIGPYGAPLGVRSRPPKGSLTPAQSLILPPIHTDSGVMFRRSAAVAAGGFDTGLFGCIGLDFWYRLLRLRSGNAECIPEPLVLYRRRPGQISGSAVRMERNLGTFLAARATDDPPMPAALRRRVLAAHRLYWASLADEAGDPAAARAYTAAAWRTDPAGLILRPYAHARAAISLASLLPDRLHAALRRAALALRARRR